MHKMGTKLIAAIIAWCITVVLFCLEVVLQVLGILSVWIAWVASIFGGIAFIVSLVMTVLFFKQRKREKQQKRLSSNIYELSANKVKIEKRIRERRGYLPELKILLNDYISRVEYLANNNDELLNLERYKHIYFKGKKFGISEKESLLVELYKLIPKGENLVFREILEKNTELQNLKIRIDGLNSFVKDKRVRTNVKGYPEASYRAYSYIVYNRLQKEHYDDTPVVYKFRYKTIEKMTNRLRNLQNETNKRIDELLEGAEDEM